MIELNKIYHRDCQELIKSIPDNSIDCICTDPPYLYLSDQKLEREFDEKSLFTEYKRILKHSGFIILFGRGTSFYRWNTILAELGFNFKEEIIWNKSYTSSPLMPLSRIHETISIFTKNGCINKVRIPYLEQKQFDIESIKLDIKRLCSAFSNINSFNAIKKFLDTGEVVLENKYEKSITISGEKQKRINRCAAVINSIENGMVEKSVIHIPRRCNNSIHPTQKPVRLIERLLDLVKPKDVERPVVVDTFAGSCVTAKAAINTGWDYICMEIDDEYYNAGKNDVEKYLAAGVQQKLF